MIGSIGLPYAYDHFTDETGRELPFICFYYPNSDNFSADNLPYVRITALTIELYTDAKDFDLESRVETILINHGLNWNKTETYIDSEKMQMEVYEMEVLINADNTE